MLHLQAPIQCIQYISGRHPARLDLPDDRQGALIPLTHQPDKPLHPVAGLRRHAQHELIQGLSIFVHARSLTGRLVGVSQRILSPI